MDDDSKAVRELAATLGLALDDDTAAGYARDIERVRERLGTLDGSRASATIARDVEEATDSDTFRYRFSLPGGDGPLSHLKAALKDCIAVAGVPMTCGTAQFSFTPESNATVTRRLVEAGADIVGTTNMDTFALSPTGQTCAHGRIENPAAPGCIPGGSSGGSAAAVAAGDVDVALGSDTGGSVRIPASFCGVVGVKPTYATVPRFGFVDLAPSLDHIGPLAKDVETAARTLDAIAGPTPKDPSTLGMRTPENLRSGVGADVDGYRIGVVEEAMALSDDSVASRVQEAIDTLADAGALVESVSLPDYRTALTVLLGTLSPEFATNVQSANRAHGTGNGNSPARREALASVSAHDEYGDIVCDTFVLGASVTNLNEDDYYAVAQNVREDLTDGVDDVFEQVDALAMPTTPVPAPEFGEVEDTLALVANTALFNLTGHPALSVPVGTVDGKPVGLQLAARRTEDATTLRLGGAVESAVSN
jgi:aspartyl-tRNA(Asn)/glutamyl-tRNA(Gln) amidotransferase subunit A